MGDVVSGADFECRYIRELPGGNGRFTRFLKQLDVNLPHSVSLADAVAFGWVQPSLRVQIPHAYFTDWDEYPLVSRRTPVRVEHEWADWVMRGEFAINLMFPEKGRLQGDWFLHPFDSVDPLVAEVRAHAIDSSVTPPPFRHSGGFEIATYVDFFPYWQAYRLMESLKVARLVPPLLNTPRAPLAAETILREIEALVRFSDARLAALRREYSAAQGTFEWVSLYRTALAAAVQAQGKKPNIRQVAKRILARVGLEPEKLKDEIQDVLLTRWKDWRKFEDRPALGADRFFQQDIKRAIDFVQMITNVAADYRESRWYDSDPNPRQWAQLHEALPFEHWLAQESFPRRASMYLRVPRRLAAVVPTTEAALRDAMVRRWKTSYAFRRFLISFHRLHELLSRDSKTLVTFREHNVIDYMVLGCLIVERMITERWRRANPTASKLPPFDTMIAAAAGEMTSLLKCKPLDTLFEKYKNRTYLHTLKPGDPLPLINARPRSGRQFVFWAFHNLRVLRNYAAHHDVLDKDLSQGRVGGRAMRVIVGCVALLLVLPE